MKKKQQRTRKATRKPGPVAQLSSRVEWLIDVIQPIGWAVEKITNRLDALLEEIGKQKQEAHAAAKVLDAAVDEINDLVGRETLAAKEAFIGTKNIDRREAFEQALEIIARHKKGLRWN